MQNLLNELQKIFKEDERLVADGKLLKNKIIELGLMLDPDLLEKLLSHSGIKKHFFQKVGDVFVFDKIKFQKFISNKDFLPDNYTSFKNRIGLTSNDRFITKSKDVVLAWPYKDCILEGGQTEEDNKSTELFWNETLAPDDIDRLLTPKVLSNPKVYPDKSIKPDDFDFESKNLLIHGNNLLALTSLLPRYRKKVKLIFIDPPYNTGNDTFGYNDKFNHSTWLTYMKNRLTIAKELLSDDGSIWISIDDDESHYLKVLCDEIFSRDNFVRNIVWQKKYAAANDAKGIADMHDHILVYQASPSFKRNLLPRTEKQNKLYKYNDDDGKGPWRSDNLLVRSFSKDYVFPIINPNNGKEYFPKPGSCWRASKETIKKWLKENRIFFGRDGTGAPQLKRYLKEVQDGIVPTSWWAFEEFGHNDEAKKEIQKLDLKYPDTDKYFSTPKPEKLIEKVILIGTNEDDLVLDFFAGSGTTGAVALKLKRRFILCEQMNYADNITFERLKKVIDGDCSGISKSCNWKGGGNVTFLELHKNNQSLIDEIVSTTKKDDLLKIFSSMESNATVKYQIERTLLKTEKDSIKQLPVIEIKKVLIDCLDKNELYLSYSEIEDIEYKINKDIIALNKIFYKD